MLVPPRRGTVQCISPTGLHRMAYVEWGEETNPRVMLCVHGLTRTGRDFDVLAQRLATHYRVVCPDIVGRGKSDWLADANGYLFPQYMADLMTLIARLDVERLDYIGTSMGGLIGIMLAGLAATPIERLLINDVGPRIEPASLMRLRDYVGQQAVFASAQEGVDYLRARSETFGPHRDEQWRALQAPLLRKLEGGGFGLRADPGIARAFSNTTPVAAVAGEFALWQAFVAIRCPVLVTRGAESDLLSRRTVAEMVRRGQSVASVEFPGVGHAPTFINPRQADEVARFFLG